MADPTVADRGGPELAPLAKKCTIVGVTAPPDQEFESHAEPGKDGNHQQPVGDDITLKSVLLPPLLGIVTVEGERLNVQLEAFSITWTVVDGALK